MANKTLVSSIGNGEYRIIFPQSTKFDMTAILQTGTHKIRVLSPKGSEDLMIGVEGERETLLDWLRGLEGVDPAVLKSYEEAMTEES